MNLKDRILTCENCTCCKNMQVGPVAPVTSGAPKIMLVFSQVVRPDHDRRRKPLSEATEDILRAFFKKHGHPHLHMTSLVKCSPDANSHRVKDTRMCAKWLDEEKESIKPEFTIGFGTQVKSITAVVTYMLLPPIAFLAAKKPRKNSKES